MSRPLEEIIADLLERTPDQPDGWRAIEAVCRLAKAGAELDDRIVGNNWVRLYEQHERIGDLTTQERLLLQLHRARAALKAAIPEWRDEPQAEGKVGK